MSLTVRELVSRPQLRLDVIVEGDLDRVIRWVHASDMPDPAPYLRGDEVVLTAGIWYWQGVAPGSFAASLGHVRAAALGFGTNPLVDRVPEDLVHACRGWNLTLFRVPADVSFIAIAEEFVEAEHRERERPLVDSLDRSGQFIYALQAEGGLAGLLRVLGAALSQPTAIVRRGQGVLANGGAAAVARALGEGVEAAIAGPHPIVDLGELVVFRVPIASSDAALVMAGPGRDLSVSDRTIIDQALAFIAIELQRARALAESERRFTGELFDLIAAGEGQLPAVTARLRSLGLDPAADRCAVCCACEEPEAALNRLRVHLEERDGRVALAVKAAHLLALVPVGAGEDLLELARGASAALGGEAYVGIGGIAAGVEDLARSVVEATHACRFAERRRDARYVTHDTIASHVLLVGLQDEHLLAAFRTSLIQPLEDHDERRRTDLVRTLERFLGSGGRYQQTAEALHVHVNTLRLRLARIEALTGRDLDAMDDRVDFWLALRARSL